MMTHNLTIILKNPISIKIIKKLSILVLVWVKVRYVSLIS